MRMLEEPILKHITTIIPHFLLNADLLVNFMVKTKKSPSKLKENFKIR